MKFYKLYAAILVSLVLSLSAQTALSAKPDKADKSVETAAKADKGAKAKQAKGGKDKTKKGNKKGNKDKDNRAEPQDPGAALDAQNRHTENMLANDKVVGTGVSWDKDGQPVIKVFVNKKPNKGELPKSLDGIPVQIEDVGNIYSLNVPCELREGKARCDSTAAGDMPPDMDPRARQQRPVPIGVSVGSAEMAGSLGCLVTRSCHNYALTNSHVAPGAGSEELLQPAAHDGGNNPDDSVAGWYEAIPILLGATAEQSNRVDAAIFAVDKGEVGKSTLPNGYGQPRMDTLDPSLNLDVMKYGRTSALTHGYIDTINATIIVRYPTGDARFIEQVIIKSDTGGDEFSLPGDSGALVVASGGGDDRMPVGLLFASAKGISVANPINEVLFELNVSIEGAYQ